MRKVFIDEMTQARMEVEAGKKRNAMVQAKNNEKTSNTQSPPLETVIIDFNNNRKAEEKRVPNRQEKETASLLKHVNAQTERLTDDINRNRPYTSWRCTKKELIRFFVMNILAVAAGFGIPIIARVAGLKDPILFKHQGTEWGIITDTVGAIALLICCHLSKTKASSRDICCNRLWLGRAILRDGAPMVVAIGALFLVKFLFALVPGDRAWHDSTVDSNRFLQISDVFGNLFALILFHVIDRLLELCWPSDPSRGVVDGAVHNNTLTLN